VCVAALKSKKSLKTHIFRVRGRLRSSMLVPEESSSSVLVMIRSKSVSICNHSRVRLVDCSRNRTFSRMYPNLMRSYVGLLELRVSKLALLKSTFNAKKFHLQVVLVYLQWFRRSSLLICVWLPLIAKKITINPLFWGSRSFKVIDAGTPGKLVSSACYDAQQVCVCLQPFSS